MPYKLSDAAVLARDVGRVEGVLLVKMIPGETYTAKQLIDLCADVGLTYDLATYQKIAQVLVADKVIEQAD